MNNIVNPKIVECDRQAQHEMFRSAEPFNHIVLDEFFRPDLADALAADFESASPGWHEYHNPIEVKKTCNNWNEFPPDTYRVFSYLVSEPFVEMLRELTGEPALVADMGLHGGGWHRHGAGGKLNTHLDYSIHPKTGLQRKLNLIVYIGRDWDPAWGGGLGLWSQEEETGKPGEIEKVVDCLFNRAVLFDTTQNSWHGLPEPIRCPEGRYRASMAVYYMIPAETGASPRERALFAPHKGQASDPEVLDLIRRRSSSATAADVYRAR